MKVFKETGGADVVKESGGGFGGKGYQGTGLVTPKKKKPKGGELSMSDNEYNSQIASLRAPVERLVAHFKNWKILHTDYRSPYRLSTRSMPLAGFSPSQSHGVLNNAHGDAVGQPRVYANQDPSPTAREQVVPVVGRPRREVSAGGYHPPRGRLHPPGASRAPEQCAAGGLPPGARGRSRGCPRAGRSHGALRPRSAPNPPDAPPHPRISV